MANINRIVTIPRKGVRDEEIREGRIHELLNSSKCLID